MAYSHSIEYLSEKGSTWKCDPSVPCAVFNARNGVISKEKRQLLHKDSIPMVYFDTKPKSWGKKNAACHVCLQK